MPIDGMVIKNGTYYGISKSWYEEQNPGNNVLSLSLKIPDNVITISNDGFRDLYSSDKKNHGVVTDYNYDGDKKYTNKYKVVSIDFSDATGLKTIGNQAAMFCTSLEGVLDLSKTGIETIGKSAFYDCTGITGVVLPSTLKNLGDRSSGSVFYGCNSLQFVRVADADSDDVFELPEGLEVLGKRSFDGCRGFPDDTSVIIPCSVTHVGSEVFYNNTKITTILVKTDDASGYDGGAFKSSDYGLGKRLIVFDDSASKATFVPSGSALYKNAVTY